MFFCKKKEQKPYPRSFAKRLTWRIMIMLFIVMSIVSFIILGIAWACVFIWGKSLLGTFLMEKRTRIENTLTEVHSAGINTVPDIENTLQDPDRMQDIMRRIVELNPSVRGCGISFRENYYPRKGRLFCPYALRNDSDSIVVMKNVGGVEQDYLTAEWFTEGLKAKEGYWSKPFFDSIDQQPLVAFLLPIRDQRDSTVAVLGIDVSLDKLFCDSLDIWQIEKPRGEKWDATNKMYVFVIDSSGTYLEHPDSKRIIHENYYSYAKKTDDTRDDYLGNKMTKRESEANIAGDISEGIVIDGEKVIVSYESIRHTPWCMALVFPSLFFDIIGYVFGGFLLFFILIGLIVVFFAGRRGIKKATEPLKQLAASADEVAKGHFDTPLPDITSRDEIHLLRDSFGNMQRSLTRYIEELKSTTTQKASMERELKISHDIQMNMLPKTFPPFPNRNDVDIYGSLTPAKQVGGDLFDFFIRDERLFFCIGDVSGKGVPASLVMATTQSLFRSTATHASEPAAIVNALNTSLTAHNDTGMFVTLFVGALDLKSGHLLYCNAGHDAPLLIANEVGLLPCAPNLPIGVEGEWDFTQQETTLSHATTLFLYTDGLSEAMDTAGHQFGKQRIHEQAEALLANDVTNPKTFIGEIAKAVHQFVGTAEQSDDLTMLAIRYR
ncbi:MAG: SpoIIE family protein phosphatase [Bacteroidaceae bacterium]|nr:SpoIIE family protein phosphatase [Bacteroidaceae bacterium]